MPESQTNKGWVDNFIHTTEHRSYQNGERYDNEGFQILPTFYLEKVGKFWSNTLGYAQKLRNHERLPDNNFTYVKEIIPDGRVTFTTTFRHSPSEGEGWDPWRVTSNITTESQPLANYTAVLNSTRQLSDAKAKERLMNKARSNQWNVPVFLAEGRKTISLVEKTATTFVKAALQLKRGNIVGFAKTIGLSGGPRGVSDFNRNFPKNRAKAISNAWLQHRYGWLPLMQDVHNAMNTLVDLSERPDAHIGRVTGTDRLERTETLVDTLAMVSPETKCTRIVKTTESVRVVWLFEAKPENVLGRLGLLNPLEVAWELIPLSFVADWFVPISAYLSGMGDGLRFVHAGGTSGYKCVTSTYYLNINRNGLSNPAANVFVSGHGDGVTSHTLVSRTALGDIPNTKLSDLSVSANLSPTRMVSAVALLVQSLR